MITIALDYVTQLLIIIILIINSLQIYYTKDKLFIYLENEITTFDFIDLIYE